MGVRRNAAVYAGLVGALALVAPSPAAALSMSEVAGALDGLFATPAAAFAAGSAAGAASAAALIGVAALVARRRRSRSAPGADGPDLDDTAHGSLTAEADAAPSYRPRHMRPDATLFEDDAEEDAARHQQGRQRQRIQ